MDVNDIAATVQDDPDMSWREHAEPNNKETVRGIYDMLITAGDWRKIVITEWINMSKADRWSKAQTLRSSLKWRLRQDQIERKVSVSVRKDGEVWVGWRIEKGEDNDR